jgi:hypothetical protein
MRLIKDKTHLAGEYFWIRKINSPHRLLENVMDVSNIVCAVAGTRPLIYNDTIYGQLPGRSGVFSFYTESEGVYELARLTDGIVYYWDRKRPKIGIKVSKTKLPSMHDLGRGQKPHDEPWHHWDEQTMGEHIIRICESVVYDRLSVEDACELHGLTHWGFESLFQHIWPLKYYVWKKNKTIPTSDQPTSQLVWKSSSLSSVS